MLPLDFKRPPPPVLTNSSFPNVKLGFLKSFVSKMLAKMKIPPNAVNTMRAFYFIFW
jgi:hypothetical protein